MTMADAATNASSTAVADTAPTFVVLILTLFPLKRGTDEITDEELDLGWIWTGMSCADCITEPAMRRKLFLAGCSRCKGLCLRSKRATLDIVRERFGQHFDCHAL
jgi:hypothetical protein